MRAWLVCVLCLCFSRTAAGAPEAIQHWQDVPSAERCPRMFAALNLSPRLLHLPNAIVRFVDTDSQPADGEAPWLLVHGYSGSLCDFAPMLAELAPRHRVVAFDLPGFGESASADDHYTVDSYVETLRDFMDRLDIPSAHLVCHSLGGHVCIAAALSHASYIQTMTLIDTAGIIAADEFVQQLAKSKSGLNLGKMTVKRGRSLIDWTDGDQVFLRRFVAGDPAIWTAVSSFRANFRNRLGAVRTPTLILWGMDDPLFPVTEASFLKENVPNATLYIIDGAGHCPNETHAAVVTHLIESFVQDRKVTTP